MWRTIWNRRIALRNSELAPSRDPHSVFDGRLNLYWGVVAWNIDRARRRMVRVEFMQADMQIDPITLGDGATLHVPPGGEDPLALPSGPLESSSDSEDGASRFSSLSGVRFGNPTQRGSPPSTSPGPTELGPLSEHARCQNRAGESPCVNAPPPPQTRADPQMARGRRMVNFANVASYPWWPLLFSFCR